MVINLKPFRTQRSLILRACAGIALLALPVFATHAQGPLGSLFGPPPQAGPQQATYTFSTPIALSSTEQPGSWYPDRFQPCLFSSPATAPDGTTGTLEESICSANFQSPAPSFFNTQGRKLDLISNTTSVSILLYVPLSWATTPERLAGFWGTATNAAGVVGNDFPIIEFEGPTTATSVEGPGAYPNGGVAGFYGWDNTANSGNGGFTLIGLPPGFHYNSWVELTMTTVPGKGYEYTVRDPRSFRGASILTGFYDATEASLANVILEGYNYNNSYNIFWDNLSFVSSSLSCVAPTVGKSPGHLLHVPPGPPKPASAFGWF